jgi:cyanate permease
MSLAAEWVGRIFAVSLLMCLPGIGGLWLDGKFGTECFALLGFGLGLVLGIASLLALAKASPPHAKTEEVKRSDKRGSGHPEP